MKLNEEVKVFLDQSVLCWLATCDENGVPNVSPKEAFTYVDDVIVIANIASPNSVKNIKTNKYVCVSILEIFVQKGFKILGEAEVITAENDHFERYSVPLKEILGSSFSFSQIITIQATSVAPIIAPSYRFLNKGESEMKELSFQTYHVKPNEKN